METAVQPIVLDYCNLPCPHPIIKLKRLLAENRPGEMSILVDNEPAVENVGRFLNSMEYEAVCAAEGELWRINVRDKRQAASGKEETAPMSAPEEKAPCTLVLIASPYFGTGDDALGAGLMKNFLASLPEFGKSLWRIILLNGGVTLATEDSPVIEELRALEKSGVGILVCGACLNHYGLLARKAVGETTNMLDVATSMQAAEKVLRI